MLIQKKKHESQSYFATNGKKTMENNGILIRVEKSC